MDGTPVRNSHKMSHPKHVLSSWLFILVASFGNIDKDCVAQCSSPWKPLWGLALAAWIWICRSAPSRWTPPPWSPGRSQCHTHCWRLFCWRWSPGSERDKNVEPNRWQTHTLGLKALKPLCAHIYESQWSTDAWDYQSQHKLELGHQDVDGSCGGEAGHQSVRQVHDNEANLQDPHCQLEEKREIAMRMWSCMKPTMTSLHSERSGYSNNTSGWFRSRCAKAAGRSEPQSDAFELCHVCMFCKFPI